MIPVDSYGLHWDGPICWLVQGRASVNMVGSGAKCPFVPEAGECNHHIAQNSPVPDRLIWDRFSDLLPDPLVQAMLPTPAPSGKRSFFIADQGDSLALYLACLSRLSSPIRATVKPLWMIEKADIQRQLTRSNIQPWVITQATTTKQDRVSQILQSVEYFPRTVILTGSEDLLLPRHTQRIETMIKDTTLQELLLLPLESLGAAVVRKYARREAIN